MFSSQLRKSFTFLFQRNASPHFCSSITPHFFSTSTKKEVEQKNSINSAAVTLFLKEIGLSDTQLEKVFRRRSQVHSASLEKTIKPKIKVFQDFGFSNTEIARLISGQPNIIFVSLRNRIIPCLSFLNDLLGGSHDNLFKVLKGSGWFMSFDIKKRVCPNIELILSYGVPMEHLLWVFRLNPRLLLLSPETLKRRLEKTETLGIDPSLKMYIHAFRVIGSMREETLEQKMQVLRDLGFTETQILNMFKKAPCAFIRSPMKLKEITQMILATDKYSKTSIVSYPVVFAASIEKKIKPRLEVLEILYKLNLLKKWPLLGVVSNYNSKIFHDKFVAPYSDQLEEAYALKKLMFQSFGADRKELRGVLPRCG